MLIIFSFAPTTQLPAFHMKQVFLTTQLARSHVTLANTAVYPAFYTSRYAPFFIALCCLLPKKLKSHP